MSDKIAFAVWDSDNNPLYVCRLKSTAARLAIGKGPNGTTAKVTAIRPFRGAGPDPTGPEVCYGPVRIEEPTDMDVADDRYSLEAEMRADSTRRALEQAKQAGLTDEQIALIQAATAKAPRA